MIKIILNEKEIRKACIKYIENKYNLRHVDTATCQFTFENQYLSSNIFGETYKKVISFEIQNVDKAFESVKKENKD